MLETVVHLIDLNREERGNLPSFYDLIKVVVRDEVPSKQFNTLAAVGWQSRMDLSQKIGDRRLTSMETTLADVPSAIMPNTWNYLLNQAHPEAQQERIAEVLRERFDNRLFRLGSH